MHLHYLSQSNIVRTCLRFVQHLQTPRVVQGNRPPRLRLNAEVTWPEMGKQTRSLPRVSQFLFLKMVHYCAAHGCSNNSSDKNISFHALPKDKKLLGVRIWENNVDISARFLRLSHIRVSTRFLDMDQKDKTWWKERFQSIRTCQGLFN